MVSFLGLGFLVRQNRQWTDPSRHVQTDLTTMQIMFGTMRDFLSDQKDVAIQFNRSLDKKIKLVREMIEEARRERQELRKAQHRIAAALAKVHEELGMLGEDVDDIEVPRANIVERYEPATEWTGEQFAAGEERLEEAAPAPNADDFIDAWAGVDLALDEEEEAFKEALYQQPETPENAEAARNAFRSLLNLEAGHTVDESDAHSGNGVELTPLEVRVYEYDDAGMRASEIAKELGVEKSHVRAILAKRAAGG
jgi:hypothetical protein